MCTKVGVKHKPSSSCALYTETRFFQTLFWSTRCTHYIQSVLYTQKNTVFYGRPFVPYTHNHIICHTRESWITIIIIYITQLHPLHLNLVRIQHSRVWRSIIKSLPWDLPIRPNDVDNVKYEWKQFKKNSIKQSKVCTILKGHWIWRYVLRSPELKKPLNYKQMYCKDSEFCIIRFSLYCFILLPFEFAYFMASIWYICWIYLGICIAKW